MPDATNDKEPIGFELTELLNVPVKKQFCVKNGDQVMVIQVPVKMSIQKFRSLFDRNEMWYHPKSKFIHSGDVVCLYNDDILDAYIDSTGNTVVEVVFRPFDVNAPACQHWVKPQRNNR